jgi:hypothetical protein
MQLWTPPCYGTPNLQIRRSPDAVICESSPAMCDIYRKPGATFIMSPNGTFLGAAIDTASDALERLEAAGPRGAAALGAVTGLIFSGWKAAAIGGLLGYFSGKYIVNIARKALAVSSAVNKVETSVEKVTS